MKPFDITKILEVPMLSSWLDEFEQEIDDAISSEYLSISEPTLRLIKAKSKRLRPSIIMAIVANKGLKLNKKVISSCIAVELVHIASLVHDDIIDNASTRRGVPTINAEEGVNQAIIIGDYLFSKAYRIAASVDSEVAGIIAQAIENLCVGQMLEMDDQYNLNRSIKSLVKAIEGKTASLISASSRIGGYCSGLANKELDSLTLFGKFFGMSFQFIDDLLDFLSSEKIMEKPIGNDTNEGIYNTPILLSFTNPDSSVKKLLKQKNNINTEDLVENLINDRSIEKSIMLIGEYNKLAEQSIKNLKDNRIKKGLSKLPNMYTTWALSNLVKSEHKKFIELILAGSSY